MTGKPRPPVWMEIAPPVIAPDDCLLRMNRWAHEIGVSEQNARIFLKRAEKVGIESPFRLIGKARIKRATRRELAEFVENALASGARFPKPHERRRHDEEDSE